LSIVYGWTIVKEFLDGAHDMDNHFVSSKMRQNLPVLLALCDVWNGSFLGLSSRIVAPYSRSFASFPALVTALESQACSRPIPNPEASPAANAKRSYGDSCPSLLVDGGADGTYDRFLYQSSHTVNTELLVSFDNQIEFHAQRNVGPTGLADALSCQDSHMCSLFAHADELALGSASNNKDLNELASIGSAATAALMPDDEDASSGNRPSILVFTGKVDAFVCGQLVALSEHRAVVKSHLLGLDPFVRRCGSSMRLPRSDLLKETLHSMFQGGDHEADDDEDDNGDRTDPSLNLATRTLLRHYANHSMTFKLHYAKGV
jgi:glucose-6-phosphate isomerase